MADKPHPFSDLTVAEIEALIDRARRERAAAIASAFASFGRRLQSVCFGSAGGHCRRQSTERRTDSA